MANNINEIKYTFYSLYNKLINEEDKSNGDWIEIGKKIEHCKTWVEEKNKDGMPIGGHYEFYDKTFKIVVNDSAPKVDLHDRNTFLYHRFIEFNIKILDKKGANWGYTGQNENEEYIIYPKYKNTYWDWLFNGLNETAEEKHEYLMSQLDIKGDKVILKHLSPYKITDGYVGGPGRKGPNFYSNNSDVGNYFWAGKKIGADPSTDSAEYIYYCEVALDEIYDFEYNPKGYESIREAASNEAYVAAFFGGSVAAVSNLATKIIKQSKFGN